MQTAEQIKKQITQGEPFIRQFTMRYFSESYSQDPELLSLVLESCQNLEYTGFNQRVLEESHRFVYTKETVAKIINALSAAQDDEQEAFVTKEELGAYQWLLAYAPFHLLEPYQAYIDDLPQELKELIEYRRALSLLSSQELWDKFSETNENKQVRSHNQIEQVFVELLVKELASRQELLTERIPQLVNMLNSKEEALIARAVEALVYIGTEEVVETLQADFAKQTLSYRLAASSIFGRIKLGASETAILRLFPKEKDKAVQTNFAQGICQLLSLKGIPLVWKLLVDGYERSKVDLGEYMYVNYSLNELELPPELTAWKEQQEQKLLERESGAVLEENEQSEPISFDLSLEQMSTSQLGAGAQVAGRKIGRNDPCPCGSGKKYKKCCG